MPWNAERRTAEILVNRENIEDAFTYLNETKQRVKKLERLTEGVNSMNKNYNYDDSIKRLYDITNNYSRRLDRIEERLDGSLTDYSARGNRRNRVARRTGRRRRGGGRTRRRRRKRGAVRTKHNTPKVFDPKTMKVIPNPHYKKPKKPSPITLSVQGQRVTFHPREVEQQRKMLTQLKKLSPASSSKAFQLGSFNPQTNKGGRRKKGTRRRGKKGGHAGNTSSLGEGQYTYTELAAMRTADPQRVYYLYIINTNSDPPLVAPVGNGFTHEFQENTNGDKIAITGHRVGHHNQNPAYTIPNPANNNTPPAIEVVNNFYNPAPGVSREFRDISDIMGNLQMGGSGIKSTIEGNSCDFLPHHKLCKGGRRRKSRRRMRRKRKGKTRRKMRRKSRRKRKR